MYAKSIPSKDVPLIIPIPYQIFVFKMLKIVYKLFIFVNIKKYNENVIVYIKIFQKNIK